MPHTHACYAFCVGGSHSSNVNVGADTRPDEAPTHDVEPVKPYATVTHDAKK